MLKYYISHNRKEFLMEINDVKEIFDKSFDLVGVIKTKNFIISAKSMNKEVPSADYPTMVILGYAYPKRTLNHSKTHLVPSFYTFGRDYHKLMKDKIKSICEALPYAYNYGVDNHPLDERLGAELSGIGFIGKNQLLINKDYGTYLFLGYVLLDVNLDNELPIQSIDDCGDCRKCIEACPTNALTDKGYIMENCISYFNQTKKILSLSEIKANHSLFGCDICQLVCPKNIGKGNKIHSEFNLSGKEQISIKDLFIDSQKEFNRKYHDMAYLWKGKTILMRNALTLMYNHKNTDYLDLIKASIDKYSMPWYKETASFVLDYLNNIKNNG